MRVPQSREREVLVLVVGDDLQDDQPVREPGLGGQVSLARSAPTELREYPEGPQVLAGGRKRGDSARRP